MIRGALAAVLLLAAAGGARAQETVPPPAAADEDWRQAPPRFPAVGELVRALAIEEQAAWIIDAFWRPAEAALVAANPDRAEAARRHAAKARAAELAIYPQIIAMEIDHNAIELLNPEIARRLEALQQRRSADYARTRQLSEDRLRAFAEEHLRITAPAAARTDAELAELSRLALTPDGLALRELQRNGFYQCALWQERGRTLDPAGAAPCARLGASPALARLKRSRQGERLVTISNHAHTTLIAMVAMGHAAGFSVHRLLPPEEVRAAGLAVPPDAAIELQPPSETPAP